jgi:hypothetical protein
MGHEVIATIRVPLPDEPQSMAATLAEIAGAWSKFLATVAQSGADVSFSVNETRGKPGPRPAANGAPRAPRKTRNSAPPATQPGPYDDSVSLDEAQGVLT